MATETLRPSGVGSETSIDNTTGSANHWENVDEASPDDATTENNTNSATYQRDLYAVADSGVGVGTINSITVHIRWFAERSADNFAKVSIKSGATVTDGDIHSGSGNNTWNDDSQTWATNPDDAGAWEWADIDALEIGCSLIGDGSSREARITQVYVVVDYTPESSGIGIQINISDVWKEATAMQINIGDVWKDVVAIKINIGDTWKDV